MAEGTIVQTMSGATLWLSAERPATFDAAGYSDTGIDWTEIGQVENFGDHGVEAQIVQFIAVKDAAVQKLKGSKDYGTMSLTLGTVESDAGQDLLDAASESQNRYSAKIVYPLRDGEATPATHYLDVLVASFRNQDGAVNDVRRVMCALAICQKPVKVAGA